MKLKRIFSTLVVSIICTTPLNCITSNALSLGDVNSDNTIDSSDASLILEIYADFSTGKTPNKTQDELSVADVNSDNSVDSTDASTILEYYAYVSTGGSGTLQEFISPSYQSDTNTFILPRISIELPKSFKYVDYSKDSQGDTSYLFASNDDRLSIEESITPTGFTDEEILQALYDASKSNSKYTDVQIVIVNDTKFVQFYYPDDDDTIIFYTCVINGRSYLLGLLCPIFDESKETMIVNVLKSITTDITSINIPCSNTFENLSATEKQYVIDSIMMFSGSFINAHSINIHQCCETIIDNQMAYIYDISYISSANSNMQNTFIFYPETNKSNKSYNSYEQTISKYTITEYNAELINAAIRDYYNQFE